MSTVPMARLAAAMLLVGLGPALLAGQARPPGEILPLPEPPRQAGLTLDELERAALANHPALAVARAGVAAAEGNWLQVGLKPNPTVGYIGDNIGESGSAGGQGGYFQQEFITGHKLSLNRQVAAYEIARAQAQWEAATARVLTDVRVQFYRTLLAERRLETTRELAEVSRQAADAARRLWEAKEGLRVDFVRASIEADRMRIALAEADAGHVAAFRELAAFAGLPNLPRQPVAGDVPLTALQFDFHVMAEQFTATHPLVAAARADADRTAWAVRRAEVEAIPNIQTYIEVKQATATDDTVVLVQAGVALPLWNRNQGGIQQAHAEHAAAHARVRQVEFWLQQQLAGGFRAYDAARAKAERYAEDILPGSQTTVELAEAGLAAGELSYIDLLSARQTYYEAKLNYLDALEELWVAAQRIEGLMLEGSLAE